MYIDQICNKSSNIIPIPKYFPIDKLLECPVEWTTSEILEDLSHCQTKMNQLSDLRKNS